FALSTSAIFVKIADAPSAIIAFYRLLIAGVVLLPFFLLSSKSRLEIAVLQAREWRQIIAAGLFLALHYVMWFESLKFTSIASSTMLVSMQPLFSLGLDRFVQNRTIKRTALIGCIVALVGCIIIGAGDLRISGDSLFGDILAFAAAGVIALYFFVGETVRKNVSALTYSVLSYLISAVILAAYSILQDEAFGGYADETWLSFIGLALIATIGGQFVFNLLLKKVSASAVTMSILGEPIGTCILAYLLLNEGVMLQQFIGIAVIMSGMTIFFSRPTYLK
ncbi:MAG: EamA family transporter, partial [Selenomonadales bacterium]|nr:EamA family transporter [Selenomonadales bacterium]